MQTRAEFFQLSYSIKCMKMHNIFYSFSSVNFVIMSNSYWLTLPIVLLLYYGSQKPKFFVTSGMKTPFTHNDTTALNATQSINANISWPTLFARSIHGIGLPSARLHFESTSLFHLRAFIKEFLFVMSNIITHP